MKISDIITENYSAYVLSKKSRRKILDLFPPKFSEIKAHHITNKYGISKNDKLPHQAKLQIVGYASDNSLEAAVVSVNGKINRPDGKIYHLTISHNTNRKPVESNNLLTHGWKSINPIDIEGSSEILK